MEQCWQSALASQPKPMLRVDLTGVTFIDDAGKVWLAAMHRQGAEFVAGDCMTKSIVSEITGTPETDPDQSENERPG
jgi:hypothetical protein